MAADIRVCRCNVMYAHLATTTTRPVKAAVEPARSVDLSLWAMQQSAAPAYLVHTCFCQLRDSTVTMRAAQGCMRTKTPLLAVWNASPASMVRPLRWRPACPATLATSMAPSVHRHAPHV